MKKLIYVMCCALLLSSNVPAEDISAVQVDVLAKTEFSWDGSRLPDYPDGTPEIRILRIKIPPGAQLPLHKHPVLNVTVVGPVNHERVHVPQRSGHPFRYFPCNQSPGNKRVAGLVYPHILQNAYSFADQVRQGYPREFQKSLHDFFNHKKEMFLFFWQIKDLDKNL